MTRILRVKGAFLEMLRGKLEDSNFSISLGLCFFSWVYVSFLRVYMGFMYGFRAHCQLLKSRLNEMNDWRLNKGQILSFSCATAFESWFGGKKPNMYTRKPEKQ